MTLKPYPKYKPSGVEWLGDVPEHWNVAQIKRGFIVKLGKMLQPKAQNENDLLVPYMRASNIQPSGIDITEVNNMWLSPAEIKNLKLASGDLLVSEGGDVGRCALWKDEIKNCYFQNSINRIRASKNNSNSYLMYLIQAIKDKGAIDVICNKLSIAHLTAEKLNELKIIYPLSNEQTTIANFLDRETTRIDNLITKQQRMIELLKEKRQAVISHAVTKGLDPTVKMKKSGVEWLGEVPEHWEVKPLKTIASYNDDVLDENTSKDYELQYVDIGSVDAQFGVTRIESMLYRDAPSRARRIAKHGDIIVSTVRTYLRAIAQVVNPPANFVVSTGFAVIRPKEHFNFSFAAYAIRANYFVENVVSRSVGISYPAINASDLVNIDLALPPIKDQLEIANYLDNQTSKFDALIEKANQAIELLKERRTALISAAVTGKIDVREAA